MDSEFDYDLKPDQWEALKALRLPAPARRMPNRLLLDQLVALELACMSGNESLITEKGRKVLLRGSPRLLDVVA